MSAGRKKSFREETQEVKKSSKMPGNKRIGSPLSAEREKDGRIFSPEQHPRETQNVEAGFSDSASFQSVEENQESSFYRETEGAMRDKFVVDIKLIDGEPFKGTITRTEALKNIFVRALGFSPMEFHGATPSFRGHPIVIFKTKRLFNIDERLAGKSYFDYEKKVKTESGEKIVKMSCTIKGIREEDPEKRTKSTYTWLKIEGAEYQLKEEQIKMWLSEFGFVVSDITEDKEDTGKQSSEDEDIYEDVDINTGIYSVKINLKKQIPQLIPMHGKKIKIYHKGIQKQCMNCFETGHFKKDCKEERKQWLDYVDGFMLETKLPGEYFGIWEKLVIDWRLKNERKHDANRAKQDSEEEEQDRAKKERAARVLEIAKILEEQRISNGKPTETISGEGEGNVFEDKESTGENKEQQETELEQSDQKFTIPAKKTKEIKTTRKPNTRGRGRGRGGSQSLHSSPTTTPSNGRSNE